MKIENNQFTYTYEEYKKALDDYFGNMHGYYVTPSVVKELMGYYSDFEGNFMKAYYKYSIGELNEDELDEYLEEYDNDWLLDQLENYVSIYGIEDFFNDVFLEPEYNFCELSLKEFYERYNGWDMHDILADYYDYNGGVTVCDDAVILS